MTPAGLVRPTYVEVYRVLLPLAGAFMIAGTLLPWITASSGNNSVSENGLGADFDGWTLILVGVFVMIFGGYFYGRGAFRTRVLPLIGSLVIVLGSFSSSLMDVAAVQSDIEALGLTASYGVGLWIVGVGVGLVLLISITGPVDKEATSATRRVSVPRQPDAAVVDWESGQDGDRQADESKPTAESARRLETRLTLGSEDAGRNPEATGDQLSTKPDSAASLPPLQKGSAVVGPTELSSGPEEPEPHTDHWCPDRQASVLVGPDRVCPGCGELVPKN